ncbi:thiamine pyrophosphate-binding protein [Capnocytophaga canis]|uniref:thiamine pyrophosphate-binding protein n=1 Tax=Capnocytophaga canis TaxID=1848903 RepID=UPI00370D8A30
MKVVSYIAQFLKSKGIDTVFELQGGMITRIIDELFRNKITIVTVHHEQAAAMAADAYARIKNIPGVALATSGPGATNLLTGIGNCFFDSVPAIFITGQVNTNELKKDRNIRQLGFQETDIVSMASPITKASYLVEKASDVPSIFEEAFRISMEGRPGPVLIDIPMNIQYEECKKDQDFIAENNNIVKEKELYSFVGDCIEALKKSKRPLILAGRGIRVGGAVPSFLHFVEKSNIPVVTSLNGLDTISYNHPNRIGFIGTYGNRWANYALGSCDLLLVFGSRLDMRQTGADTESFMRGKQVYHIDIEEGELNNRLKNCKTVRANVLDFFTIIKERQLLQNNYESWYREINEKRKQKPDIKELQGILGINPNQLVHRVSQSSMEAKAFSTDVGSNQMWVAQSIELNANQIFLTSGGMGSMGYSLPAAIGACFALNKAPIVCFSGDGGFQINIQELQTIVRNNLPIKIVILNNRCLGMIRQFQDSYFESSYVSTVWGYSVPDFVAVSNAYGIEGFTLSKIENIEEALIKMWKDPHKPFLLDVSLDIHTNVYPKMLFGNPLTEMEPIN